tara:strand:+ start:1727 stop:1897 length:171 start_codon:yes stop_codon:yes gene_type:complete
MNIYSKMHTKFIDASGFLRRIYGIRFMSLEDIQDGKWLSEDEIADFTLAYMGGGEL